MLLALAACAEPALTSRPNRAVMTLDTIDREHDYVVFTLDGTPVDREGHPVHAPCVAGCARLARPGERVSGCRKARPWTELVDRFDFRQASGTDTPLVCFFSGG
jgi:hypothetical protein